MNKQISTLPTRSLGTTGMTITRVGFGAWAIGGGGWSFAWGSQDDEASLAAMRRAIECGVNWIDTAAVYGLGHSEKLVGRLLRDYPAGDRPYVFTKCGLVWNEQEPMTQSLRIGEPASLRREVEQSLTRLGVDQIDLYQMHWPAEDGTPVEVYWQTLLDLKREGKVRAVGLSNHKVDRLDAAERLGHVDTLQPPFSAIRRDALAAELPWCLAHDTGVIVYSPMQSGLLTGSFTEARAAALAKDDWRSRSPEFQSPPPLPPPPPTKTIGAHGRRNFRVRACRTIWRWPRRSGRSPRATTRPSAPSLSPGLLPLPASPAPSSERGARSKWTGGSLQRISI